MTELLVGLTTTLAIVCFAVLWVCLHTFSNLNRELHDIIKGYQEILRENYNASPQQINVMMNGDDDDGDPDNDDESL